MREISNRNNGDVFISVVVPVYGCCGALIELWQRLKVVLNKISEEYEIILVNDCSPDSSWETIKEISYKDKCVKGINLSRNFGQHHAITAGLDYSLGEWVVVMDCDLQDRPEEILRFYEKASEGYDIVTGRREKRKDSFFVRLTSYIFYKVLNYFSGIEHDESIANFGLYSRKAIDSVRMYREQYRSFGMCINSIGFERANIVIQHEKRAMGKSSYGFYKRLSLALDTIVAYSNKPLKLSIKMGFVISFVSFIYAIYIVFNYFLLNITVPGWTTVVVSLYLLAGLGFINVGFLGLYVGKVFDETKKRPLYIVESTTF